MNELAMEWIPVKEKLPNEYMDVLLTVKEKKTARTYVTTGTWSHLVDLETGEIIGKQTFIYFSSENGKILMFDYCKDESIIVIAWMPFPKPCEEAFRVIVAGSRSFDDYVYLKEKLNKAFSIHKPTSIVCGEAKGADALGRRYAEENGINIDSFPADWIINGKQAGYIRNEQMADNADALIAFWNGTSAGTKHMINTAKKKNLQVRVIKI